MAIQLLLLSSACLLVIVVYLWFRWQYRHILAAAAKLPCPPALPVLGNALFFTDDTTTLNKKITDMALQHKKPFCLWMGPIPVFVITSPADVKKLMITSNALEKDISYKYLKPFMGNGIITGPVSVWKKYRRLIDPVFHHSNLETFIPVFNEVSRDFVKSYISNNSTHPVNPKEAISSSVINAAMKTILGSRIAVDQQLKDNLLFLFHWVGTLFIKRLLNPFLHFDWIYKIIYMRNVKRANHCMTQIYQTINQRHSMKEEDLVRKEGISGENMMNIIINDSVTNELDAHWMEEIITVTGAATDSISASLCFLLITLANHPNIQDKIYTEIQDIIAVSEDDVTADDLQRMEYLGQVILESMRLHGTVPIIMRRTIGPIKLGDLTLPAGSRVMISLHAMGWNPEVFPDTHVFRPERFSRDIDQDVHPRDVFMPFSAGPRNCIGKQYSILLMKSMIVHILRQYTLSSHMKMEDIQYELKVVMQTRNPLFINFKER